MRSLIGLTISVAAALALIACGGSSVGGGISCPASQLSCTVGSSERCVDPHSDRAFCGASGSCQGAEAGTACASGEVCANGSCATSCPPDQLNCGGTCVTPATDREHCGASGSCQGASAGARCGGGQVCANGACATSCPANQVACDGKCIDPDNDSAYCNADATCHGFTTCAPGQLCANGACAASCPTGQVSCGGKCIDPLTDRFYCHADSSCQGSTNCSSSGLVCANGTCATSCPADQVNCDGTCITPATDRDHCGASGTCQGASAGAQCGPGQVCGNGACATSCPTGQVNCDGKCIDPLTSRFFCNADASCHGYTDCSLSGQVCGNGACATSCPADQVNCDGTCVTPATDRDHCGASGACQGASAGAHCGPGQVCGNGACATSCPTGQVNCDGKCIDPLTSRFFCNADASCHGSTDCSLSGQVCGNGACATSCPTGQVNCGGKCIDPASDHAYCGANGTCTVFATCTAVELCVSAECKSSCPAGEYACGNRCVDPDTDSILCGVHSDCSGGTACGAGSFCNAGACWSPCGAGMAFCDSQCVDPSVNRGRCGASGLCSGVAAGTSCHPDQVCNGGSCACPDHQSLCGDGTCQFVCAGSPNPPAWEWKASVPLTAQPRFPEPADPTALVAHIVFDGTTMVDIAPGAPTHWSAAVAPPFASNTFWSPAQRSSGPFSASAFWVGDTATRDYLQAATSGPFTICARYKPGAHPGLAASKVVMALGKPDPMSGSTPNPGGWALLQMQDFAGFRYNGAVGGDWIVYSSWPVDSTTLASIDWVWHCGGWDGNHIRTLRESVYATNDNPYNHSNIPALTAGFPAALALPAIGNYADGSAPLSDGAVYEIIITREGATEANAKTLVARASGGLRIGNEAPVELLGADGHTHRTAPSTVRVETDGSILADQAVLLPAAVPSTFDPVTNGQCFGVDAEVADWTSFGADNNMLKWASADGSHEFRMNWRPGTTMCMAAVQLSPWDDRVVCQNYGAIATGRHRFQYCISPDRIMRMYVDGTQFGTESAVIPVDFLPHLESPGSLVSLTNLSSSVKLWRVWACAGSDPATCP